MEQTDHKKGARVGGHLKSRMISGLLVLGPLTITLFILKLIFSALTAFILPVLRPWLDELPEYAVVAIAQKLGVSDLVIGLTIVAAGTSLPELATSVVASIRGERDIAVGNVVGSNIFNILAVLGLSGNVSPSGIAVSSQVLHFDLPVMVVTAVACLPIFLTGSRISRPEGALFLCGYMAYAAFLVAIAMGA